MARIKKKKLSPVQQYLSLKRIYPTANISLRRDVLRWRGQLQPLETSLQYLVEMSYRPTGVPRVRVVEPALVPREEGVDIPHLYSDFSLCLYYPKSQEWTPDMFIAETVIPWASEWLAHYEIWRVTGVWHGGGVH